MSGIKARGGRELRKHLTGDKLTQRQMILAKCYDCMGGYGDGKIDCEIPECPLYLLMPYKNTPFASPNIEKVALGGKDSQRPSIDEVT